MMCFLSAVRRIDNRKKESLLENELEAISKNQMRDMEEWNRTPQLCSTTFQNYYLVRSCLTFHSILYKDNGRNQGCVDSFGSSIIPYHVCAFYFSRGNLSIIKT